MKNRIFIVAFAIVALLTSHSMAQTLSLQGTGNTDLDGIYLSNGILNGRNSYSKKIEKRMYSIYCKSDQHSTVWMIVDEKNNVFYGANSDSSLPPQQGWDKGRAGKGLNDTFSLVIEHKYAESKADPSNTITFQLKNNSPTEQRIVIRALAKGKEVVRVKAYKPMEVYGYEFEKGTEVYLLTEQEGETLMNTKGKVAGGRLLLKVSDENNHKIYDLF